MQMKPGITALTEKSNCNSLGAKACPFHIWRKQSK